MKSTQVFGNYPTSRWELQKPEDKGKKTMADDFLGGQDIRKPKKPLSKEGKIENLTVDVPAIITVESSEPSLSVLADFEVLKAAVADYISGDITFEDLKSVYAVVSSPEEVNTESVNQ